MTIGDIFNYGRNALVVISGEGWIYIYYSPRSVNPNLNIFNSKNSTADKGEPQDNKNKTGDY